MALPSLWKRNRGGRDVAMRRADLPFLSLQRDMNRLFEDFWHGFDVPSPFGEGAEWTAFNPRIDIEEKDGELQVTAELPGLEQKDFDLSLAGDTLFLRGEKREEREDKASGWHERSYGRFERAIPLPVEVDTEHASAEFKNGVLRVHLPTSPQARERSKRIPVSNN
jgi:HSP20 family protein